MLTKLDYTQQILKNLPDNLRMSEEEALRTFWQDPRTDSGFRLSYSGYKALKFLQIEHYAFDVPPGAVIARPSALLTLNRKMLSPYFIGIGKNPCIVFFGSKEATLFSLYGDINKFISSLSRY